MKFAEIEKVLPWKARIWWSEVKRRHELQSLAKVYHPFALNVCRAINKTIYKNYTDDELSCMKKIETLRDKCMLSSDEIEFIDYGAGDPNDPRTLQESRMGINKKVPLSQLASHTSKSAPWSNLIFNLVKEIGPHRCLELGTCIGFSASYQCSAMMLNGVGSLVTLEGAPSLAEVAQKHLNEIGASNFEIIKGRFEETLETVLEDYAPFDFMFNDGHHDGKAMINYFEQCLSSFSENALLLFDDIGTYQSMRDAWSELCRHNQVAFAVEFGPMGLLGLGRNVDKPIKIFKVNF